MAILFVAEHGSRVKKVGERLVVTLGDKVLEDVPLIKIERVVLMQGSISVTTPTLFALARRGIPIVYLKGGLTISGQPHKRVRVRYRQALAIGDYQLSLRVAREIVRAKVLNQRVLVQRHAEQAAWAKRALQGMADMAGRVDKVATLDELRGLEGNAAREYFGLLRRMLKEPMGFERRAYHPPTDPINALLSFLYTLLLHDCIAACDGIGLDAYLGFFHALDFGRPSMALDLEEAFRPVIADSLVLTLVNQRLIKPADFQRGQPKRGGNSGGAGDPAAEGEEEGGEDEPRPAGTVSERSALPAIYLNEAARRRVILAYEERMNSLTAYAAGEDDREQKTTYRRVVHLQAEAMARLVLGEGDHFMPLRVR